MRIRYFLLPILMLALAATLQPGLAQANKITDAIQKRYDATQFFQADFQQELTNAASGSVDKRSGRIIFKQPSLVRWDTQKPEKELLIVGQKTVWDYFESEKVVLKYKPTQVFSSKTMIRFLSGKANLKEDFKVEEQGFDNGLIKLRLIPKEPEPSMVLAYLWVDSKTSMIARVLIVDFYGNGNQMTLQNISTDRRPDASAFEFTVPQGVQVKDNTKNSQ